jgi:exodeoxyribonuclease-3
MPGHDDEGRVVTCTFSDVVVVCVYTPNSGEGMKRLGYRGEWDEAFRTYVNKLAKGKLPVIVTGDLNVAHQPIDIARPKENYNKTSGYTQQEIDGLSALLTSGWVDTFRHLHPDVVKYSWWSQRFGARAKNVGWRIDYVLVTKGFEKKVKEAFILNEVMGSDHCPVGIVW